MILVYFMGVSFKVKNIRGKVTVTTILVVCVYILVVVFALWKQNYYLLVPFLLLPFYFALKYPELYLMATFITVLLKDIYICASSPHIQLVKSPGGLAMSTNDIFIYLLVPLFLIWTIVFGRYRLKWKNIFFPLFLLAFFFLRATYFSENTKYIILYLFNILGIMTVSYIIFIMVTQSKNPVGLVKRIFHWMANATVVGSFVAFVMIVISINIILHNPYAIRWLAGLAYTEPNFYGSVLLTIIYWTWSLSKTTENKKLKLYYAFALFVQIMGLILTFSRGTHVSFLLTPVIFVLIFKKWIFKMTTKTKLAVFLIIVMMVGGVLLLITREEYANFFEYFFVKRITGVMKETSVTDRLLSYEMAIRMTDDNPWGGGPRHSLIDSRGYVFTVGRRVRGSAIMNDFLSVMADAGVQGLICWVAFLIALIWKAKKVMESLPSQSPRRWLLVGTVLGLIGFLISGLSLRFFEFPHIWFNIGLLVALLYMPERRGEGETTSSLH